MEKKISVFTPVLLSKLFAKQLQKEKSYWRACQARSCWGSTKYLCQLWVNKENAWLLYSWLALSFLSFYVTNKMFDKLGSSNTLSISQSCSVILFLPRLSAVNDAHRSSVFQVTLIKRWKKSKIQHFSMIIHLRQQLRLRNSWTQ